MRKCIRCECEMRENYDVKVEGGAYGLKITKQGIFKDNLGKVHVAVCPECGYLEFYLEDTAKIKD
ncbi:MAG: nucleic acid-binding protein [Clostridia bacterium]|nr:nucleic acid-binding protein [Clostridia bacterium]